MIKKNTKIIINISLDENYIPEKINWITQDINIKNNSCKALMLSFWNEMRMESERIDLWIKDMPINEMIIFFYQTFLSMADTYYRATSDENIYKEIINFANFFVKKQTLFK